MNRKIKKLWVEALRSGKYRQANADLFAGGKFYCCLGVLARVQGARVSHGALRMNGEDVRSEHLGSTEEFLKSRCAAGLRKTDQEDLASMNDGGHSFAEIADYIQKNL